MGFNKRRSMIMSNQNKIFMTLVILILAIFFIMISFFSIRFNKLEIDDKVSGFCLIAGNHIQIDGQVNGLLFTIGNQIVINSHIKGNVIALGKDMIINGIIEGSLYSVTASEKIIGKISEKLYAFTYSFDLNNIGVIDQDAYLACNQAKIMGHIVKNLVVRGNTILVGGQIGNDAKINADEVVITPGALIQGNLNYIGLHKAPFANEHTVKGQIHWEEKVKPVPNPQLTLINQIKLALILLFLSVLIWGIIKYFRPTFWENTTKNISNNPKKTLLFGLIILFIFPFALLLLFMTIIGVPFFLFGLIMGGLAVIISYLIVAVFIGNYIKEQVPLKKHNLDIIYLTLGLIIIYLFSKIPYMEPVISLLIIFTGLGSLYRTLYELTD
jgi:cytoskeletal protein CcmA (bactofilin family)